MKKKFGIDISYHKACRAIQKVVACISGSPEENYQILPSYLHMMVCKNPGTYTSIKRDAQNRFAYMFFAPAASVAGWSYCGPVIVVDAMFLKFKYRGVLFVVVSKDANNQIFPLYFGVAESENNEAYIWFFEEMRKAIQVHRKLVFLSDRNQSIANGIRKVFPEAHYDLNQLMYQLKSIDKKTYNYIMEEPPERWARSWFPRRRYDMLTTNMVESMNFVLLKGREMPILGMLDFIQEKLGEWFYERRKKANETFHSVSIWEEEEMTKKMDLACKMFVSIFINFSFLYLLQ
ncbi:protein FAR1-RELATED SEQUENCE 5-like [Nicotiana tabacum]|uniref:Protein FAR1-RELATED SEQUENCE 5-like n=1 Tax=Nicotiana tabacum TaxID=4097 RepID=A0AC58TKU8_TOBAC